MTEVRHRIRSEALDALRAKERDAKRRLARHFVAFVRAPKRPGMPRGWVFYATDNFMATHQTDKFLVCMVGNPQAQVHGSRDLVQAFHRWTADQLDEQDVYASVVLAEVKEYQQALLEDRDEPRANAVEFLFIDDEEDLYWCDWSGGYGGSHVRGHFEAVIIRGCYNVAIRKQVREVLLRRCRRVRPSKATLTAAVRDLKRITHLPQVGYVSIP